MCSRDEWTFTVHVTRHHDSRAWSWSAAVTDGPAHVGDAEIGESANLLGVSAGSSSFLATTVYEWISSAESRSAWLASDPSHDPHQLSWC